MESLSHQLSQPGCDDLGEHQHLQPIFAEGIEPSLSAWESERHKLRERWDEALGTPSFGDYDPTPEVVDAFDGPLFHGTLIRQPVGPDTRQLVVLMEPEGKPESLRPGAIVPFYHPDDMAGFDLTKRLRLTERSVVQFGWHLVQQGFVVACPEAFPYNTVPQPVKDEGFARWQAAADKVLRDNPHWTGMGKLIWDTRRAVDLLMCQPHVDADRILLMGHSLGGKMAFYTGCLDERVKAIIASDFGIGWSFTNWDAPWYLGNQIHNPGFNLAHHQLLALHAPRSFLLIGGEADRPESWQYLNEAKKVYQLYGKEDAVGFFHHGAGHSPTEESLVKAYRWLGEQLRLPEQVWEL